MPNQRAEGTVLLCVPMHQSLKGRLKKLAHKDKEQLATWTRQRLREIADRCEARIAKKNGGVT